MFNMSAFPPKWYYVYLLRASHLPLPWCGPVTVWLCIYHNKVLPSKATGLKGLGQSSPCYKIHRQNGHLGETLIFLGENAEGNLKDSSQRIRPVTAPSQKDKSSLFRGQESQSLDGQELVRISAVPTLWWWGLGWQPEKGAHDGQGERKVPGHSMNQGNLTVRKCI